MSSLMDVRVTLREIRNGSLLLDTMLLALHAGRTLAFLICLHFIHPRLRAPFVVAVCSAPLWCSANHPQSGALADSYALHTSTYITLFPTFESFVVPIEEIHHLVGRRLILKGCCP
uniref:Uncharacterized protein n=1 Tax=Trypanosoma vivax (strain Y486) TaxID=1055687 RepID=G0TVY0_TRYVY|nr:conserved hypothetical protein [Trypanosoma vivax Y486]